MSRHNNISPADRKTWADAIESSPAQNCDTCHLRDRCPDPRKSRHFACALWIEKGDDPSSNDFLDLMRDLVRRESVVADKYAIDDREAPHAPNSYVWNCHDDFLNFQPKPYPKQLELSLKIFSDMCSFCRGPWFEDIPYDCDVLDIPRKVMLREFGVCPRCGKTRLDGIRAGREKDYNTLVSILGQRSGKSVGMTLIISYVLHQLLKIKNPSAFYGLKSGTVLYNTIVGITYGGAKQNVFDPLLAAIDESPWFCIAEGTPVSLAGGTSKPIEQIVVGDVVRTLEGSAPVDRVFDNGVQETFDLELESGHVLRATDKHHVRCVVDGELVWKPIREVVQDDVIVIEEDENGDLFTEETSVSAS